MRSPKIFLGLLIGIFIVAGVSAVSVSWGQWADGSTSATITQGQTASFDYQFNEFFNSPMSMTIKMYDSSGNLIYTFLDTSTSSSSYSNNVPIEVTPAIYKNPGKYDLVFYSNDAGNNPSTVTITLTVTSPPTPTNTAPTISSIPNQQVNESSSYSYQVSASDSDGDHLTYSLSGAPEGFSISSTGLITGTTPAVSSDTNYNIQVGVSDGTNPTVTASYTLTVKHIMVPPTPTLDTIPPTIILNSPANNQVIGKNMITFSGLVYDNVAVKNVTIFTSGPVISATDTSGRNDTYYNFTALFPDGTYSWHYEACDTSGNCAISPTRNFTVDTTPPVITLGAVTQNGIFNINNLTVTAHVTDNVAVANVSLLLNGVITQTDSSGLNNHNYTFQSSFLPDGHYTWAVEACDPSGNCATTSPINFTIDTVAPVISFGSSTTSSGNYSQNFIYVNVNSSDSTSGVKSLEFSLYNSTGTVKVYSSLSDSISMNVTGLADGTYYLNATAEDNAGNVNSTATRTIILDTIPPAIQFVSPTPSNNSELNQTYIPVNITVSDSGTGVKNETIYLYNSSGLIETSYSNFANFTSLPEGVYYINATAYDLVGNFQETSTLEITLNTSSVSPTPTPTPQPSIQNTPSYSYQDPSASQYQEQLNQTTNGISLTSQKSQTTSTSTFWIWALIMGIITILILGVLVILARINFSRKYPVPPENPTNSDNMPPEKAAVLY